MTSWWAMLPHNSSSLLLTVPLGLRKDTKSSWTCRGKADLHRCGVVLSPVTSGTKKTPPMPVPAASQAPTTLGSEGTSSAMRVGRLERSFASHRKSWRTPWTARVRRSRGRARSSCRNASWRRENKPRAPGNAMDMERSSPSILCQVLVGMVRCVAGMESRISERRSARCGGRAIVWATVSISQPNIRFFVDQVPLPFLNFLSEAGS